jgi:hypothetical protein
MTLTEPELTEAVLIGVERRCRALFGSVKGDQHGFDGEPWGTDIEAACAEKLVSKKTGQVWHKTVGEKDDGRDVGDDGVRHTRYRAGHLLLHKTDDPEQVFWLVIGPAPQQRIIGFTLAKFGQQEKFWNDGKRPCYFVPQSILIPWVDR